MICWMIICSLKSIATTEASLMLESWGKDLICVVRIVCRVCGSVWVNLCCLSEFVRYTLSKPQQYSTVLNDTRRSCRLPYHTHVCVCVCACPFAYAQL